MDYKKHIAQKLHIEGVSSEEIESFITATPSQDMGDYALPCFRFAKTLRKSRRVFYCKKSSFLRRNVANA